MVEGEEMTELLHPQLYELLIALRDAVLWLIPKVGMLIVIFTMIILTKHVLLDP